MTETENQTEQNQALVTISLDVGEKDFYSLEELEEWLSNEKAFYAWMEAGAKKDGNCAHAWNVTNQWLTYVNQFISKYKQNINNEAQLKDIVRNLHQQIEQHRDKGHLLTSQNPDSIFGKNLSGEEGEVIACYAMLYLMGINANQNTPNALTGAFYAFNYRKGSVDTVKSQSESLETIRNEWNQKFKQEHNKLKVQNESLIEEITELKEQFSDVKLQISEQKEEYAESFSTQLEESKNVLSDIAHTYDSKLALQSSVNYWTQKRKTHTDVMLWVGGMTILLATLTGGGFIVAAHKLLQVTASQVELWRLGVMLAISTFGIWVTRLAAKIFISNLHLRTDADERVTMIQTYLALLREGSGPLEEERQLILQTLFRPSTTGFIKDDGPSSFHELVNKALSKK